MKYANYEETTGKLLGWYDSNIHTTIPIPNIEVNEADWQIAVDNNYNYIDITNGTLSSEDFRIFSELQEAKINELKQQCSNQITSGFTSNALGSEYTYQSEQIDQLNLIAVVTAGTDDVFKCSADNGVTWAYELHTITQLQQVLADGKATKQAILAKYEQLKAQVNSATTQDELDTIQW